MKINVTQEHIDRGVPKEPRRCVLALAFKDAGLRRPVVLIRSATYGWPWNRRSVPLPDQAARAACDFDCGRDVQPFSFDLDVTS